MRLTTHPEAESAPMISPDGRWIAFEASYDGPREVYVMPITGGAPVRATHEGGGVAVRGWLDDNRVIYRTSNIPGASARLLRTVNRTTLQTADIPLSDADQATLLGDGATLAFTRYGLASSNDNAVQYRGGTMGQLWRYKPGTDAEAVRLAADFGAPIQYPMAWNGRIYFVTDKSGTDNIWSVDEQGGDPRQHTRSTAWQMRSPYLYQGRIAYQSGADLFTWDIIGRHHADQPHACQRWRLHAPALARRTARISRRRPLRALGRQRHHHRARPRFVTAFTGTRRRVEFQIPEAPAPARPP
jgi:tricorn protease